MQQDEIAIHQSTIELEKKLKESLHARILNGKLNIFFHVPPEMLF